MTDKYAELQKIGKCSAQGIADMVAALECDYDRLEELRAEKDVYVPDGNLNTALAGYDAWAVANPKDAEELAELEMAAGECTSREDAEQRIQEDPLSLEVRSCWTSLGEPLQAEEFNILLCTGGPAVRIVGELDDMLQPRRAWIEAQDWFTSWTQYFGGGCSQETLLTYCRQFYFGG